MKKTLIFSLCLMLCIGTLGCAEKAPTDAPVSTTSATQTTTTTQTTLNDYAYEKFRGTFTKVEEKDANFTVYASDVYEGYVYEVFDNDSHRLDEGFHDWRGSFDLSKEGDIVMLEYGYGGTNVWPDYRFYDVENSKVSRYFNGPVAVRDGLVAYLIQEESTTVMVQNIFDKNAFCRVLAEGLDMPLKNVQEFSFSEDGTAVTLTYCENGNESNVIVKTFTVK